MDLRRRVRFNAFQARAVFGIGQRTEPAPTATTVARYDRVTGNFIAIRGGVGQLAKPIQNKALPYGRVIEIRDGDLDYL